MDQNWSQPLTLKQTLPYLILQSGFFDRVLDCTGKKRSQSQAVRACGKPCKGGIHMLDRE
jgi:hypothetical protein